MVYDVVIPLPDTDSHGTPIEKMPHCPKCGEDELGMVSAEHALCYDCRALVGKARTGVPETPGLIFCPNCHWRGFFEAVDTEYLEESQAECPQCLEPLWPEPLTTDHREREK